MKFDILDAVRSLSLCQRLAYPFVYAGFVYILLYEVETDKKYEFGFIIIVALFAALLSLAVLRALNIVLSKLLKPSK